MMLIKRDIFAACFDNFDYYLISKYDEAKMQEILNTEGMIRSISKIKAIVNNAKRFIEIISEFESFDNYIWSFSDYKTIVYKHHQNGNWETKNELSDRISYDLKKRGFKYLGSITVYSHLQSCGIINDHENDCYKYRELLEYPHIVI